MSAVPQPTHQSFRDQVVDPAQWIALDEAAEKLGQSPGHLRRRCNAALQHQGMARHGKSAEGGQARWWINRDYDARLWPGGLGKAHQIPHDELALYPVDKRNEAFWRAACVESFRKARSTWKGAVADWLPGLLDQMRERYPGLKISRGTLYRWEKIYQRPADVIKLVDTRGGNRKGEADPAAWDAFRDLYLSERRPSIKDCWQRVELLAKQEGWRWLTYTQCRRQLDSKITPEDQALHRDPAQHKQSFAPYIESRVDRFDAGDCWVGDHAQLDFVCQFGKQLLRPWLTAWMDWRTRRLMGWTISPAPNSTAILSALRHGLKADDLVTMPSTIWIDNGKDYDCYTFHGQTKKQRLGKVSMEIDEDATRAGVFSMLGIEAHFSIAHNPDGKSRLERWFGFVHGRFDKCYASYCGGQPDDKPSYLNKLIRKNPGTCPPFDQVVDDFEAFAAGYNHSADHAKEDLDGLSPDAYLRQHVTTRRRIDCPAAMDQCLQVWHEPVKVGRNGITLKLEGKAISYGQFEPALRKYKARRKADAPLLHVAYDPHDVSSVQIYDDKHRFVCSASMNMLGSRHGDPVSQAQVKDAIRQQRKARKQSREATRNRLTEFKSIPALVHEQKLKDKQIEVAEINPDAPLQIVRTAIEGGSNAAQNAVSRKAAGAESSTVDAGPITFDFDDEDEDAGKASGLKLTLDLDDEPSRDGDQADGLTFDNDLDADTDDGDELDVLDQLR